MKDGNNFGIFTENLSETEKECKKAYLADLNAECDSLSDSSELTLKPKPAETTSLEVYLLQEGKIQFKKSGMSTEFGSNLHENSASSQSLESVNEKQRDTDHKGTKASKIEGKVKYSTSSLKHAASKDNSTIILKEAVGSQKGSRKWQEKVSRMRSGQISKLIKNTDIARLMLSRYGNYFCQVMFEKCSQNQIFLVFSQIKADLCILARDIHGTHSLQKLICFAKDEQIQKAVVSCLEPFFLELALV